MVSHYPTEARLSCLNSSWESVSTWVLQRLTQVLIMCALYKAVYNSLVAIAVDCMMLG
jgi:hypothetical protein